MSRNEEIMQAIINGQQMPGNPKSRNEALLQGIGEVINGVKSDLTNQLVRDKGVIVYDFNSATISGNSNWETSQSHTKLTSESIKPVSFNESNTRGLTVNQELEFENRTYGLYVYVARENITNINIFVFGINLYLKNNIITISTAVTSI